MTDSICYDMPYFKCAVIDVQLLTTLMGLHVEQVQQMFQSFFLMGTYTLENYFEWTQGLWKETDLQLWRFKHCVKKIHTQQRRSQTYRALCAL